MVVRFVCVIRVPVCARVSRVCPGSPRAPAPRGVNVAGQLIGQLLRIVATRNQK